MASKNIVTPVLKFWGFERHPFDDLSLRGADMALFTDRTTEIRRLQNALSNPLCGVYGIQGVGKSSVLNRLTELTTKDAGYPVVNVQMMSTSENLLYREILASILRSIKEGRICVSSRLHLNVNRELERVETSIKYTSSVEAAGEVGLKALLNLAVKNGITAGEEHELSQHTEDTAVKLIQKIAAHKECPFVVVIDNLERARFMLNDEDAYFQFVTKFAHTVDSAFSQADVAFVVSLDQSFVKRIASHLPGTEDAYSFSFGQLVEIKPFPPCEFYEIIRRRLESRKWRSKVSDFIDQDAFWTLMLTTGGHPRRAFAVLREAMEIVSEGTGKKHIRLAHMRKAISGIGETLDETSLLIFEFLTKHGPHSSSDAAFLQASRLSRTRLLRRLAELRGSCILDVTQQTSGTTTKDVYSVRSPAWN